MPGPPPVPTMPSVPPPPTGATAAATVTEARPPQVKLAAVLLVGAAVAVFLGVYGRVHDGTGEAVDVLFFSNQIRMKVWLATLAALLVIAQLASALRLYGKVGSGSSPAWLGDVHRLSGTVAFVVSLPVAFHCLWSLGFKASPGVDRVFVHSVLGCLFYGAFATKVLAVRSSGLPALVLPVVGGVLFASLVGVWLTSAFWYFDRAGLHL